MIKRFLSSRYEKFYLSMLVIATLVGLGVIARWSGLNIDEREHLYATYLVSLGRVPYRDFFEHHHPLFWYLGQGVLFFFYNTHYIWYVLRAVMLVIILITALYVYKITMLLKHDRWFSIFCATLYLLATPVRCEGVSFRPDSLMILFFVIGLYYFFYYLQSKKNVFLYVVAVLWFLSFMTLQKALICFIPVGLYGIWLLYKKEIEFKEVLKAGIIPLVLYGVVLLLFWHVDAFEDYYILNWKFNVGLNFLDYAKPSKMVIAEQIIGVLIALLIWSKSDNREKILIFLYIVSLLLVGLIFPLVYDMPIWDQYFMLVVPYWAILIGLGMYRLKNMKAEVFYAILLLGAIVLFGDAFYKYLGYNYHHMNLTRIVELERIILEYSDEDDLILHNIDVNLVGGQRLSAHGYYFYSLKEQAPRHSYLFGGREMPRLMELIKSKMPKIVANFNWPYCHINWRDEKMMCGEQRFDEEWMSKYYTNNGFIYIRTY